MKERGLCVCACVDRIRLALVACVLGALCLGVGFPLRTMAAPLATPSLPPRPTPRSTATPQAPPPGAYIELQVLSPPAGIWTQVQWQDSWGGWHDVEGWRGTLDAVDQKVWWVAPRDFGTGPYRWAIFASQNGPSLGGSDPFDLPGAAEQRVRLSVSVSSQASGQASSDMRGDTGIAALPPTGGTRQPSTSHLIALLFAGLGLLVVLGTLWCTAPARKFDGH